MTGCIALVVAAGRGSRLGGEVPKQYRNLGGRPVLRYSLQAFLEHPRVDAVG
ncbi:MAG: 2-C-methyl-D-erythritol 4-phosphate cytidylyltransferase, partial [Candidatus Brocadiales bacterium]|nr:2-C-methyl-D-erythritol 4-phosphate cytidylyltransferase [Candidatus Bathyanammoxibius sp.]